MPILVASAPTAVAVVLATAGAVLFGLAAVRQHGAVHQHGDGHQGDVHDDGGGQPTGDLGRSSRMPRPTLREQLATAVQVVRQPAWLIGAVQAGLGGILHIIALALAPITLVQPIGVIAVPVTVVAWALRWRRRPRRTQLFGALMSVAGIAALTVLLLDPATGPAVEPSWVVLAVPIAVILGVSLLITWTGGRGRPSVRCVSLAVTAAVLFGLNSILIRAIDAVAASSATWSSGFPLLITASLGIAAALPVGVWAMQRAYVSGSPQVVICCLTLVDPLAAVVGGRILLHDGGAITGLTLVGVIGFAVVAAGGVVLLSSEYPAEISTGSSPDHLELPTPDAAGCN